MQDGAGGCRMAGMQHKTCYFFGTFNPIHIGHLILARCAYDQFGKQLGFEQVLFIPAGVPPHRQHDADMLPARVRLEMVRRAVADEPVFGVSDIELEQQSAPTYTWDMLKALCVDKHGHMPEAIPQAIPMIIGSDALRNLHTWHAADQLLRHCLFLQAERPGTPFVDDIPGLVTRFIDMPPVAVSATWIRTQARQGASLKYVIPDAARTLLQQAVHVPG